MKIADFEERIQDAVLVADGEMGSMLFEGAGPQRCFEELNASQPEAVSCRILQQWLDEKKDKGGACPLCLTGAGLCQSSQKIMR